MISNRISVIVPTKNSSKTLDECLRTIKEQTYKNVELIVVDNFSTDTTLEIAKNYTDKIFSKGPERSSQRNYGAAQATGEFVMFIDSDMELSPKVIESCVQNMASDNGIVGVIIPEESFGVGFWAQCKKLERSFYVGVSWMEAARFFRKSAFDAVLGYDEVLVSGEDWDLSQRVEKNGPLGRARNFIYHNEGQPKLLNTIKKKFYYAREFTNYKDIRSNSANVAKQTSIVYRYALLFRHPSHIMRHPLLFIGMLFMKTMEFFFGGLGYLLASKKNLVFPHIAEFASIELPSVSFVLPTYNAEKYLVKCLNSITKQDYPKDKVEILLVDGGSTDATIDIALRYPVRVLKNEKCTAEYGKTIGIMASKGDHFVLIDADNEIVESDWLKKMVRPLIEHSNLFGVESLLSHDASLSSLNRYFARMRVVDPMANYLASNPVRVTRYLGYEILEYGENAAIVTGANGFLWYKPVVMRFHYIWKDKFEEANFGTYLHEHVGLNYAVPTDVSIRHFYSVSLREFSDKRLKIAHKMQARLATGQYTWLGKISPLKIAAVSLYLGTIIGPILEAFYKSIKYKTSDYIWHPIVCFQTILIYIFATPIYWYKIKGTLI